MPDTCNPNDCPVSARVEALEKANEQHGDTHREIFRRLNEVEKDNAVQEAHYQAITGKLDEIASTVKVLADKPAKRWDGIVDKAVWAVLAAIIAFLLGRVGL